jgi:hypothetical protein
MKKVFCITKGKTVSIIGLLGSQPNSGCKPETSISIVRMDRIELDQAR